MKFLFLGTSAGMPTKTRNVTGLALIEEKGRDWYLIDCGEGTQHQLLHTSLSLHDLKCVFITHVHGDHCYGLLGLLASAGMQKRQTPLHIVAPEGIETWVRVTQQQTQLHLPFELIFIKAETLTQGVFGGWGVQTVALSHRVPSFAFVFTEQKASMSLNAKVLHEKGLPQGALWGRLQQGLDVVHNGETIQAHTVLEQDTPRKIIVCGDNARPDCLKEACEQAHVHVLVHEATYTLDIAQKIGRDVGHCDAYTIASFAQAMHIPHLVLTHFSPRYVAQRGITPSIGDIEQEAASVFHGNLVLAEDFAQYHLKKTGEWVRL